jgi:hypothetical protein
MRHSDFLWVVAIGIVFCGFIIYLTELSRKEETYKINCQALIGGWHPDVPKKFVELCEQAKMSRE